jgi:hypothetical protein
MKLTPAIKGQITKAINTNAEIRNGGKLAFFEARAIALATPIIARSKHVPREQAKHAARKYLKAA